MDGAMTSSMRPFSTPPERRALLATQWPWSVCLSHTSDLARQPARRSFVEAAKAAVARAGHGLQDMGLWSARPSPPHLYCVDMVEQSHIYVGLIGIRYGTV